MASVTTKMGLSVWDQPLDPYNYQQLAGDWNIIDFHDHTPGRGVQIPFGGIAPGAISKAQLTPDILGSRGALNLVGAQTVASATYTTMPTPDQVTGIVLPTNGLIEVSYQATWQESVQNAAKAAIFLGTNQVQVATNPSPIVLEVSLYNGVNPPANTALSLGTTALGLARTTGASAYTGDVTTGQLVGEVGFGGGPCQIFAAAGTYTVSVQFKASSGTVTASNRKLWVGVRDFS